MRIIERRESDKKLVEQDEKIDKHEVTQAWFRRALTTWMIVFTLVVGYMVSYNRSLAQDGKEAHDGICTLKADYQRQNREAVAFLLLNPKGLPGIPSAVIQNSIRGRKNTIEALSAVKCN